MASEMVKAGVPLPEISQVLRHRSLVSTAIYANPRELHQMGEKLQVAWSAWLGRGLPRARRACA